MATRVWNFLLPESGSHQLRVEQPGAGPGQTVFLDGVQQPPREALIFTGPGDSLLELRKEGGHWALLVNGLRVEEYTEKKRQSGDESLRELRSRPDGSYLISTGFDTGHLELHVIRKFRFLTAGRAREVAVAHKDCIWQVLFDGQLVERLVHKLGANYGEAKFQLEAEPGERLDAVLHMKWLGRNLIWRYELAVNDVQVPVAWSKVGGEVSPAPAPPEVLAAAGGPPAAAAGEAPGPPEEEERQPPPPENLPQGVSFDAASGAYQANIRGASGKFVFLGEFATAEEAHGCYLAAVPVHCPEKRLAPELPG